METIAGAAFDLDGTLYPNYALNIRVLPFVFGELPLLLALGKARDILRADPGQVKGDFYDVQARIMADILKKTGVKERLERLVYRGWEPLFKKIRPFAGVTDTLRAFRDGGLKLGILSDFPPSIKLRFLGLGEGWDAMICSEETGALKPHPRPFGELARAMALPPEQILYVGNSPRYDIAGAAAAGMKTALIRRGVLSTGRASRGKLYSPDFVFKSYRQLQKYVLG
jgi:putative hydrolase of the HAD superfamily